MTSTRFAVVNERHGHAAGDSALQLVAGDCLKWKRRIDQAARIGGEEFALLLPETDERGAFIVAERLRRATHRTFAEMGMPVTISFGVASSPAHGNDAVSLLRAADRAMAAAKDLGSDRTVIYSDEVARTLAESGGKADGQLQLATVIALAEALDIRDTGTGQHSHTVGRYAELMARELGFEEERVERVRLAGVLHDIGKIGVSDRVLSKPGPLDAEEWQEMYTHPEIAARLLSRAEFDDLRAWILAHHERPDGLGYPYGLKADADPCRGPHPRGGRRVRGDDRRPRLPLGARCRRRARGARGRRGQPVRPRGRGRLPEGAGRRATPAGCAASPSALGSARSLSASQPSQSSHKVACSYRLRRPG